jgi:hypothetical protein
VDVWLENVKMEFLPANMYVTPSASGPGHSQDAKVHFRKRLAQRILINIQKKLPTKITVLPGLQMITGVWCNVTGLTIHN